MTEVARRLEQRDLIARRVDPADRRAVLLAATAGGRRLRQRMDAAGAALFDEYLREWTSADRGALATLLDRFTRQLTEGRVAPRDRASGGTA